MQTVYSIVDWDEHFENNRTRGMKTMRWTPIPNSFDGEKISELIEEGGPEAYGAWCALLGVAGRCERRGLLARTRPSGGCQEGDRQGDRRVPEDCGQGDTPLPLGLRPHTPRSLSRITGLPPESFEKMLPIAVQCGLVMSQVVADQNDAGGCQEGDRRVTGSTHPTDYGMEGTEGREGKEEAAAARGESDRDSEIAEVERLAAGQLGRQLTSSDSMELFRLADELEARPEGLVIANTHHPPWELLRLAMASMVRSTTTPSQSIAGIVTYLNRTIEQCLAHNRLPGEDHDRSKPRKPAGVASLATSRTDGVGEL